MYHLKRVGNTQPLERCGVKKYSRDFCCVFEDHIKQASVPASMIFLEHSKFYLHILFYVPSPEIALTSTNFPPGENVYILTDPRLIPAFIYNPIFPATQH